jgi:hypothetical protein
MTDAEVLRFYQKNDIDGGHCISSEKRWPEGRWDGTWSPRDPSGKQLADWLAIECLKHREKAA